MTWMLQAAVVLAVPLTLLGAVWLGVRLVRKARAKGSAAAGVALGLQTHDDYGLGGFRGWLADWVDGASTHHTSTHCDVPDGADSAVCDAGGSDFES